jgi:hypothetical protein
MSQEMALYGLGATFDWSPLSAPKRTWTSRLGHHSTFGRSGQIAPHGSLSLRACLRGQSAVISSVHVNSFSSRPYFAISPRELVLARPAALGALDPQHAELADQVTEDDRAVMGHCFGA